MKFKKQFITLCVFFILILFLTVNLALTVLTDRISIFREKDSFTVCSTPINVADNTYSAFFCGTLQNQTDRIQTVEQIAFTVRIGSEVQTIRFDGFSVHPNDIYEFTNSKEIPVPVSEIQSVTLTVDGEEIPLTQSSSVGFSFFVQLLLLVILLFFTVREIKAIQILKEEEVMLAMNVGSSADKNS